MTEGKLAARCEGCGKLYKVPSADRTYACKQCGGDVRALGQDVSDQEEAEAPVCPHCGADAPGEDAFCSACGAALAAQGAGPQGRQHLVARRRAAGALSSALKTIKVMRWLYGLHAVLAGAVTALAVLALQSSDVPLGPAMLAIAFSATATAVSLVAVLMLPYQPFLWSVLCASWVTMTQFAVLLVGGAPVLGWVWVAVLWFLVAPTVHARRLVRENPDLYAVHRLHGTEGLRLDARRAGHASNHDMRVILARARAQAWRRSALLAGAVYVVTALAAGSVYTQLRPGTVDGALAELRKAWSAGDTEAIAELFADANRSWQRQQLERTFAAHGWDEAPPALPEPEVEAGETRTQAVFGLEAGAVVSDWQWAGRRWVLLGLELPPPPIDPVLESFAEAWNAGDLQRLAEHFQEDSRERMEASLRKLFARRGWTETPPAIRDWKGEVLARGRAEVRFRLDEGPLTTRWSVRDGASWSLTSIQPPKD